MEIAFYMASGILLLFSLLATLNTQVWYVKIFDFFKVHINIFILLTLAFYAVFIGTFENSHLLILIGLLLSIGINLVYILPFTPLHSKEIQKSSANERTRISLFIANVRMSNRHTDTLRLRIKEAQPDAILLTETDQYWIDQLADLEEHYPYTIKAPLDNTYGMVLYSRIELLNAKVHYLIEKDIPSIRAIFKLNDTDFVHFFGLHPRPPAPWTRLLNKQAEILLVAQLIAKLKDPVIVAGDLNDVGWSKISQVFKKISGLYDPRIGRGLFNTYNAQIPLFRYPIDHIFISDCFKLKHLARLDKFGSDHFPMLVEVSYEPAERQKVKSAKEKLSVPA
jgi:endonuclease/exonuclease/phosphatase (EEP) superfamily protein YafD